MHTDAAKTKGLGFILLQKDDTVWKPVCCGSRVISDTESRYSMVELELLGVVWELEKCSLYLLGMNNFKVVTDHKPLLSILNNKTTNEISTPRLQRLKERTIRFGNFEAVWKSGK